MEPAPDSNGAPSGGLLFYSQPEPLSVEAHGKLGINRSDTPFQFAEQAQAVPLQVTEFGFANKFFPIIFAGADRMPMAMMSLRATQNTFITQGKFEPEVYVPAFIRRYPFALANGSTDVQGGAAQMIVCIDRDAAALSEHADIPLFENGHPSPFTLQMIEFCSTFEADRLRTERFVNWLRKLDLFESKQATFTPRDANDMPGTPVLLAEYFAVSEEKLVALPDETIVKLNAEGALRQIYAHLDSMHNWERLMARGMKASKLAANRLN